MKLLFLTDKYYPKPYANAICAQELIREFKAQGHEVEVLAYLDSGIECSPVWEDNPIHYVKPDRRLRLYYYADNMKDTPKAKGALLLANILSKSKKLVTFPLQPFYSFSLPQRVYNSICALHSTRQYDALVAILNPLDSALAACRFKKKHTDIPVVIYAVDTLGNGQSEKVFGKHIADGFLWEKQILTQCDGYIYMAARAENYKTNRYEPYRNKLYEADLPRLSVKATDKILPYKFKEHGEHWVYAGAIGGVHYNPKRMLELFREIAHGTNRILHLYVRGTDADRIKHQLQNEKVDNIVVHGYVEYEILNRIMNSADVLVTVKTSNHISAKIFECISYGKPCVHFSGCVDDANAEYVEKYALGHVVKTYQNDSSEIVLLNEFLNKAKGKKVSAELIRKQYEKSTPEYSVKMISKIIENIRSLTSSKSDVKGGERIAGSSKRI